MIDRGSHNEGLRPPSASQHFARVRERCAESPFSEAFQRNSKHDAREFIGGDPSHFSGWKKFFHEVESLRGKSCLASIFAEAAFSSRFAFRAHAAVGMKAGSVPCGHQRRRHGHRAARGALLSCCSTAAEFLRTGGAIVEPVADFPSSSAGDRARASICAASRAQPLSFRLDMRGRFRSLYNDIVSGSQSSQPTSSKWSYDGGDLRATAGPAVPFVASRLSTPDQAAVIDLSPWLSADTLRGWHAEGDPSRTSAAVKGYFRVPLREWRGAVRKMARSGLLVQLDANAGEPSLRAGAFTVQKDDKRGRFIADRRPMNSTESIAGPVRLPYAPRLRRICLDKHKKIFIGKRDLSNAFYQFRVDESRRVPQVVGPRIPKSWLDNLDDESLDSAEPEGHWYVRDLFDKPGNADQVDPEYYCQVAAAAVLMGDVNAVTVIQESHARIILRGSLWEEGVHVLTVKL